MYILPWKLEIRGRKCLLWRLALGLLNKQLWTPDKGWLSIWGIGGGLPTISIKVALCLSLAVVNTVMNLAVI
jgi:hypothetical protein